MSAANSPEQGRGAFARQDNVAQETLALFDQWNTILSKWNKSINLVQRSSLEQFWTRHAADSWQVTDYIKGPISTAIDLGSGGGFPGLAVGIWLKQQGQGEVTLVESAGKKAAFLRTAAREMTLPVKIEARRAESLEPKPYDLITARAFAPLLPLLGYAERFYDENTQIVLLKGSSVPTEIEQAQSEFDFDYELFPSISDPQGYVLTLSRLRRLETTTG